MKQIYRHLSYQSTTDEQALKLLQQIARQVGEPTGRVTFGGVIELDDEVHKAFRDRRIVEVDAVKMEVQFDQNLYLTINPEMNEKIRHLLDDAQLKYLRDTIEAFNDLNKLMEDVRAYREELIETAKRTEDLLKIDLRTLVESANKEEKQRLNNEFEKAKELTGKVDAGLKKIDQALKHAESAQVEAGNIVKAHTPAPRQIKMRKQ